MIENQPSINPTTPTQTKKVSIQERSVHIGDFVVVNGYRVNRTLLKERFAEGRYQAHETKHFLLFTRLEEPKIVLVHWFAPQEITSNITGYLTEEMKPFGLITSNQRLSELFAGIVGGTVFPDDVRRAWNYFGANTLQRLLTFVCSATTLGVSDYGVLGESAFLYQRVCELGVGKRFLDAACNGGFLSLLLAERMPFVTDVVGVDRDASVFRVAQEIARERHLTTVRYLQADLLVDDFNVIGKFDTVTMLHVLEHFTEEDMYVVLANLLKITEHRLIVAVPYEVGTPTPAYDHMQLFNRVKLERVGIWCVEQMQCAARVWYEDLPHSAGLLLIERA
jgi:SAM-dependent methyltransferase